MSDDQAHIPPRERVHVCSICGEQYRGWGNNAEPVNDGRCCDFCDWTVVIPTRIVLIYRAERGERR